MDYNGPYVELYRGSDSNLHDSYWFMSSVKLRLTKGNKLYLLINHYHSSFGGITDDVNYFVFLGEAKQENFRKIQKSINKSLRRKLRKLRFKIAEINDQNKKDDAYYIHATCKGSDERFGDNQIYHYTNRHADIKKLLKDKKEYDNMGYDVFYRKKYIV
jgi:hypothetical protein